jgi:hypothetical protein
MVCRAKYSNAHFDGDLLDRYVLRAGDSLKLVLRSTGTGSNISIRGSKARAITCATKNPEIAATPAKSCRETVAKNASPALRQVGAVSFRS